MQAGRARASLMDSVFMADAVSRSSFLRHFMHSFGGTYICLWVNFPQTSNNLSFMDGFYQEESSQPSSSSSAGSLAERLFREYRTSVINIVENHDRLPGLAFNNSIPYLEIKELDLLRLASLGTQLQFYQEARIKTAIFMGCKNGVIELGMPNVPKTNMEMEMKAWFPEDFSPMLMPSKEPPQLIGTEQNRPSSSSSSLRSVSMDSPDQSSSLLFNIPISPPYLSPDQALKETGTPSIEHVRPLVLTATTTITTTAAAITPTGSSIGAPPYGLQMNFDPTQTIPIFASVDQGEEVAAMTRAMLAVISSPSSSSSIQQPQQNFPLYNHHPQQQEASAFKKYGGSALAVALSITKASSRSRRGMLERAVTYFRNLHSLRLTQQAQRQSQMQTQMQASQPTMTQLHHMISERKRREKLNESFQALKSILPPGSKKDKASVLASTREYLSSLQAQVSELSRRNEQLEAAAQASRRSDGVTGNGNGGDFSGERIDVQIANLPESTPEERHLSLRVRVRGECPLLDLTTRILEFLKRVRPVSLLSLDAESTQLPQSSDSLNRVVLRLKVEGDEWDESAFREAVRRVVADLAQ